MNNLESAVYNVVRKHPGLKKAVKTIYQGLFDLLPEKKEYSINPIESEEGYFFGFHDVCPFSKDETKVLANEVPFDLRMPQEGEPMTVGFFDFSQGKFGSFHPIAKSYAWNYHKGCRLQWLDEKHIIFNTAKENKLVSCIVDITDLSERFLPYPIDSVYNKDGLSIATSFCYERLNKCMPGYGYPIADGDVADNFPADSGLFLGNIISGECELCVPLSRLADEVGFEYKEGFRHFVTHTEFSPDGLYVSFLYRAVPIGEEGKDMHKTWIMVYDLEDDELTSLPTHESGSHYVWNNADNIIASCIVSGKCCHILFDIGDFENYKIVAGNIINSDGHQTWLSNHVFITDTYPDRRRMAKMYKVDIDTDNVELLAELYSPKQFQTRDVKCHIACDLHPRLSPSGKYLCFDSPKSGKRSLCVMKI